MAKCRECGAEISGKGRRYCEDHVPPVRMGNYRLIYRPEHHRANRGGYVKEHIVVAEQKLGRPIKQEEMVHHMDGDGLNNCPDNLRVFSSVAEHFAHHRHERQAQTEREVKALTPLQWRVLADIFTARDADFADSDVIFEAPPHPPFDFWRLHKDVLKTWGLSDQACKVASLIARRSHHAMCAREDEKRWTAEPLAPVCYEACVRKILRETEVWTITGAGKVRLP